MPRRSIVDPKTDLNLPAGNVTLNGREAAQFLRTRHGVGDGSDIGRISNQQVYMSALMRKLQSSETLSSPVTLYSIAKVAAKNVTLSDGLDNLNTMVSIALALKDVPAGNFALVQYPVADVADGVVPITDAARTLMDAVKADKGLVLTGGSGYYGSKPQSPSPEKQCAARDAVDRDAGCDRGVEGRAAALGHGADRR